MAHNATHNTVNKSGVISWMPSFSATGEANQRTSGYDPVSNWMNQFNPKVIKPVVPPVVPPPKPSSTGSTGSTGSTSGTGGMTAAEALALAKFNYEKTQDTSTRDYQNQVFDYNKTQDTANRDYQNQVFNYGKSQDAAAQAAALEALQFGRNRDAGIASGYTNYYDGGKGRFNTGFDKLLSMITDQGKVSGDAVSGAYGRAMTGINEGYDAAQGLGDSGYNALNAYLQANPNNPYANMQASVGSSPDAMSDYLKAYGVSDQPVQGQIQADQLQAQQGAGNYQNLIDVLSGVAQSGASSRGAESAMGQNLFNTGLGQERAGYRSQAENAQAAALAQLQQQMFQSRFGVEGDRNSLSNQLAMAVIAAGGNVDGPTTTNPTTTNPTTTTTTKTVDDATDNQDDSEVSRTYEGIGPNRIRITKWTSGKETREPDPDKNYKAPADTLGTMDIKPDFTQSTSYDVNRPVATDLQNQLANLATPAQAQGLTAQQLLDQLNERRGYVQQQPTYQPLASMTTVQSPQIQALLQQIAAQQVAGNSSGGGRGNLMDMF